jgi:hypothetical protein
MKVNCTANILGVVIIQNPSCVSLNPYQLVPSIYFIDFGLDFSVLQL